MVFPQVGSKGKLKSKNKLEKSLVVHVNVDKLENSRAFEHFHRAVHKVSTATMIESLSLRETFFKVTRKRSLVDHMHRNFSSLAGCVIISTLIVTSFFSLCFSSSERQKFAMQVNDQSLTRTSVI